MDEAVAVGGKPLVNREALDIAIDQFADFLLDEEIFYIGREVGRRLRWGELEALGVLDDVAPEFQIIDVPGLDIFGQPLSKKYNFECECPKCNRTLAASRFAPHLEKCMGMGRNSSRVASRRLAATATGSSSSISFDGNKGSSQNPGSNSQLTGELGSDEEIFEDDEDDEEWTMERKKKTKKSEKAAPKKKGALQRLKAAESSGRGKRGASPSVSELQTFSLMDMPIIMEGDDVSSSQ